MSLLEDEDMVFLYLGEKNDLEALNEKSEKWKMKKVASRVLRIQYHSTQMYVVPWLLTTEGIKHLYQKTMTTKKV